MAAPIVKAMRRFGVSVVVVISLLALVLPAQAAPATAQRSAAHGWEARQIQQGGLPARDRELAGTLPGRARIGYHPETGRVRFISGTPAQPLSGAINAVANDRRLIINLLLTSDRAYCRIPAR